MPGLPSGGGVRAVLRGRATRLIMASALPMSNRDAKVLSTALPQIAQDL